MPDVLQQEVQPREAPPVAALLALVQRVAEDPQGGFARPRLVEAGIRDLTGPPLEVPVHLLAQLALEAGPAKQESTIAARCASRSRLP